LPCAPICFMFVSWDVGLVEPRHRLLLGYPGQHVNYEEL
jgi:hypothetical protein